MKKILFLVLAGLLLACVDIVYAMTAEEHHDLDNGGKRITAADAAKDLKPFVQQ